MSRGVIALFAILTTLASSLPVPASPNPSRGTTATTKPSQAWAPWDPHHTLHPFAPAEVQAMRSTTVDRESFAYGYDPFHAMNPPPPSPTASRGSTTTTTTEPSLVWAPWDPSHTLHPFPASATAFLGTPSKRSPQMYPPWDPSHMSPYPSPSIPEATAVKRDPQYMPWNLEAINAASNILPAPHPAWLHPDSLFSDGLYPTPGVFSNDTHFVGHEVEKRDGATSDATVEKVRRPINPLLYPPYAPRPYEPTSSASWSGEMARQARRRTESRGPFPIIDGPDMPPIAGWNTIAPERSIDDEQRVGLPQDDAGLVAQEKV